MSYKITNAKFLNNKIELDNFNFSSNDDKLTQVMISNQNDKKILTRIFKGKEQVISGRFLIDNMDLVNPKFVKNHAKFIYTDKYLERFIPSKMILIFSSLVDVNFLRNARINHLRTKYDYLNYTSSKTNTTEIVLKRRLDTIVSKFIEEEMRNETKILNKFQKQIIDFNETKSNKIFTNVNNILKVVSRSYYKEKTQLAEYELMLTFLQAIWDAVYNFNSLRNSCTCEYNAKNSSNKSIKKMHRELNYSQTKYAVKKQLKYIGIKITEHRILIYKQQRLVKQLKKQFDFELKKHITKNNLQKEQIVSIEKEINNWDKVLNDQLDIFTKNQENYFFKTLQSNSQYISKLIIVAIHKYHQKVLSKSLKMGSVQEYKTNKKYYKNKIISIYKQAYHSNIDQMKDLGITMEWFLKSTFKLSSLNILYVKILTSINMNKKNIFLMDVTHLLSPPAFKKLIETLEIIKEKKPDINFTIVDSHPNKLPYLDQKIYGITKNEFINKEMFEFINDEPTFYRTELLGNKNTFKYTYKDAIIKIYNKRFKYKNDKLQDKGFAFVNPFEMKYENTPDYNNNNIAVITDIKKANNFNDQYMYYCKNEKGYKFYFYDKDKNDLSDIRRAIITFSLDSIAEFI